MSDAPKSFKDLSPEQRATLEILANMHPEDLRRLKAVYSSIRWWEGLFWGLGKVKAGWILIAFAGATAAWFFGLLGAISETLARGR